MIARRTAPQNLSAAPLIALLCPLRLAWPYERHKTLEVFAQVFAQLFAPLLCAQRQGVIAPVIA
jgi:hypothetical protein